MKKIQKITFQKDSKISFLDSAQFLILWTYISLLAATTSVNPQN